MEKTLSELIREYKDGGKRNFEKIAEKMNPLIEFYARKLYTWDREDARQEMLLALFLSLEKMKYCRNEGEMLSYLKTGIRRRYKDLMLKELHNKEETVWVRTGIRIGTDRNFLSSLIACFSTFGGSLFIKMSGNLLVISDVHSSMSASV